jgi:hypothetical protein
MASTSPVRSAYRQSERMLSNRLPGAMADSITVLGSGLPASHLCPTGSNPFTSIDCIVPFGSGVVARVVGDQNRLIPKVPAFRYDNLRRDARTCRRHMLCQAGPRRVKHCMTRLQMYQSRAMRRQLSIQTIPHDVSWPVT